MGKIVLGLGFLETEGDWLDESFCSVDVGIVFV